MSAQEKIKKKLLMIFYVEMALSTLSILAGIYFLVTGSSESWMTSPTLLIGMGLVNYAIHYFKIPQKLLKVR